MSFLVTLEQKLGRFALPNLIWTLAGFQIMSWVFLQFQPEWMQMLVFNRELILQGQVWRLISFVALPEGQGIFWLLFITFMFYLNNCLEEAWGSFRLNLFILFGIVCIDVGGMLFGYSSTGFWLWTGVLIAAAVYFPNEEILLMGVIPVKFKWLAWGDGLFAFFKMLGGGSRAEIFFSLLNTIITFTPALLQGAKALSARTERRQRLRPAFADDSGALHKCVKCGRSDKSNPQLEFRVTAEGDDICSECRAR